MSFFFFPRDTLYSLFMHREREGTSGRVDCPYGGGGDAAGSRVGGWHTAPDMMRSSPPPPPPPAKGMGCDDLEQVRRWIMDNYSRPLLCPPWLFFVGGGLHNIVLLRRSCFRNGAGRSAERGLEWWGVGGSLKGKRPFLPAKQPHLSPQLTGHQLSACIIVWLTISLSTILYFRYQIKKSPNHFFIPSWENPPPSTNLSPPSTPSPLIVIVVVVIMVTTTITMSHYYHHHPSNPPVWNDHPI